MYSLIKQIVANITTGNNLRVTYIKSVDMTMIMDTLTMAVTLISFHHMVMYNFLGGGKI